MDPRGAEARAARSEAVRAQLIELWERAVSESAGHGLALAVVGSHARGEAGPHSDLDLVLLHDGSANSARARGVRDIRAIADALWYPLWDNGIRFDHSVRTLAECRSIASTDLSAAVGLLDLSFVAGDEDIVTTARAAVAQDWRKAARGRLGEVAESVAARHTRFGDAAHLLAPDLKESRGGLRDMIVLRSLTAAWLTDRPHGEVDAAYARLLDVRDALHQVTGRHRERLDRESLGPVAAVLGYSDPDDALREIYGSARTLAFALDGTLRRATQSSQARRLRIGPRRPAMRHLGHGLYEHDGEVVLGAGVDPSATPLVVSLRAATTAADAGLPLAPATMTHLAKGLQSNTFNAWDDTARDLLGRVLASGPQLVPLWEGLDLAGVIDAWLTEWAMVRCRPQHSPVHRHTVDRHSIETVARASELVRHVARPDLLLIAALLHDIGKAEATVDHPEAGVAIATRVLARWGLPSADTGVVLRLVRHHLTLAELATRRDPEDPATIDALVGAVGHDPEVLALLHTLTIADASAVGGAAWNAWRASLIARLVALAGDSLSRRAQRQGSELVKPAFVPTHWEESRRAAEDGPAPGIQVRVEGGPVCRVVVTAPDRVGLFADVAGLLAVAGYAVRSARLRTDGASAWQEWQVDGGSGERPDGPALSRNLIRVTGGDQTPLVRLARPGGPHEAHLPQARAASVTVVVGASASATVIEVRAADRRGLLYDIGRALAGCGVSIRSAHIETYAGQTLDTFYLTSGDGSPLADSATQVAVTAIETACAPTGNGPPG